MSLVRAKCEQCAHAVGVETARLVCDTANTLLETWHAPMRAAVVEKFPSVARLAGDKGYDASRRGFFSSVRDEAKSAAAVTTDFAVKEALGVEEQPEPKYVKVMKDGTLPHFVPDRRERLLDRCARSASPRT